MNVSFNLKITDKKNHSFLIHRKQQVGGSTNQVAIKPIKERIDNFYNFFDAEKSVEAF